MTKVPKILTKANAVRSIMFRSHDNMHISKVLKIKRVYGFNNESYY